MSSTGPAPGRLRVMTYNVRGLRDDRAALRRVITLARPDVLLLQEAPRRLLPVTRARAFARDVGLHAFGGRRHRVSTTLLVTDELRTTAVVHGLLPTRRGDEPRGYALATVQRAGLRPITVCSVHLSLDAGDRLRASERLVALADEHSDGFVLGGDFNEGPAAPGRALLTAPLAQITGAAPTWPSAEPTERLDAIYATPGIDGAEPAVRWTAADLAGATDHRPLVADLNLAE